MMLVQVAVASLPGGSALQPVRADRKAKELVACIVEPRADMWAVIDHVVQNVADFLGPSVMIQTYAKAKATAKAKRQVPASYTERAVWSSTHWEWIT